MKTLMIYVQHLLGTGHLRRAALVAKTVAEQAHRSKVALKVVLVSGGMPIKHLDYGAAEWVQLPPVRSRDATFTELVNTNDEAVDNAFMANRQQCLLGVYYRCRPHIIVTETFPFGRRKLRAEILSLVSQAKRDDVACVASIRDILQSGRKPDRLEETVAWANQFYAHVLVHGDPQFVTLNETFERFDELTVPVTYTGFISPRRDHRRDNAGTRHALEIIVSAGGGAVGHAIYRVAIEAARHPDFEAWHWRLLVGRNLEIQKFESLQRDAGDNVSVEHERADFFQLLTRASVSVSQCGYNTMLDILNAGVRAVVVPYEADGETEQRRRAERLADLGIAQFLAESGMNAERLIVAIERALRAPLESPALDCSGATRSSEFLLNALKFGLGKGPGLRRSAKKHPF